MKRKENKKVFDMINIVELECPNCGGDLQPINYDTCKCGYCNAYFLIERKADQIELQPHNIKPDIKPETKTETNLETKQTMSPVAKRILITIGCVYGVSFLIAIAFSILNIYLPPKQVPKVEPVIKQEVEKPEVEVPFQSTYFRAFVEAVYSKPAEEVSQEELSQITSIKLRKESQKEYIDYRMLDGEENTFALAETIGVRLDDIQKFTGLKELDTGGRSVGITSLSDLERLECISCANSPSELLKVLDNPEKITALSLVYFDDTIEGIDEFKNLEYLYICNSKLIGINQLAQLSHLKQLILDTDDLMNYEAISALAELNVLEITSEELKDVEFLSGLQELDTVSLISTKVVNISYLKQLPKLRHLTLDHDNEIDDFKTIEELTDLESLYLYCLHPDRMPNLEHLDHLTDFTIDGLMNLKALQNMTQLERLCIRGCFKLDFSYLSSMKSLRELVIRCNPDKVENLEALAGLPQLEVLDLSRLLLLDDCTWAFRKAGLRELYFNDAHCAIDLSAMQVNETLETLEINHLDLYTNVRWHKYQNIPLYNYDELTGEDYRKLLAYFPNLQKLSATGDKIDAIDFTLSMPNLVRMDISDNYVKDLTPLNDLEKLEYVNVTENPITKEPESGSYILVR